MRARALPQCTVAYPNAALLTPVVYPNAQLPTPMRARALPQCTIAYPDAGTHPGLLYSRPPQVLRVPVADGASCPGGREAR